MLLACAGLLRTPPASAAVQLERLPDSGVQPQVIAARDGAVHLVYLTGDPKASDVRYRQRRAGGDWGPAIPVNSQPGSAIAIGTIRGAQMAMGRNGYVHVVWNGSSLATPRQAAAEAPLLYARLDREGSRFSTQRNLAALTRGLDGGGSVAADAEGRVFVVWHAAPEGLTGETNRAVFLALSTDDGGTFAPERVVSPPGAGTCGCCGLTAFTDDTGAAFVLFRTARTPTKRDISLLVSSDYGRTFTESFSDAWETGMCPMSSAALAPANKGTWAAWETRGQVRAGRVGDPGHPFQPRKFGPPKGAKHPRIAANPRGETLLVWTEGTGWQRGGALAWQLLDERGEPTTEQGRRDGIPVWSYAAAYARPNGDFVILY
jgi:hypothetical protein